MTNQCCPVRRAAFNERMNAALDALRKEQQVEPIVEAPAVEPEPKLEVTFGRRRNAQ